MAPLVLRKPDGTQLPLLSLTALRGLSDGEQRVDLLTGDTLTLELDSTAVLDIGIGDTLPIFGQLYTINTLPSETKHGEHQFSYTVVLEGPQYHLIRVMFFDTDVLGNALSSTFSLTGNLAFFAQVLFANMVRVFSGAWGLGSVTVPGESTQTGVPGQPVDGTLTAVKTLSFENENCLTVLQRLCDEYGTEFSIEYRPNDAPNRILSIGPAGSIKSDVYQYGQGNGLYELTRRPVDKTPFFTRAYVFGGSKNLPAGYRNFATRLQLPNANPSPTASPWDSYVDDSAAIAQYGLIEGTVVFEDIYPTFSGTVAEVVDSLAFTSLGIGFDPFEVDHVVIDSAGNPKPVFKYQIPGVKPKVSFLTGQLAGYSFYLIKYFTNNFILQLEAYTDENGLVFPATDPASPFKISVGDTYTLIDLLMPDSYVTAAEEKLLAAGQAWLAENGAPSIEYALTIDELYLKGKANDFGPVPLDNPPNFFTVGDAIRLVDTDLNIDRLARITAFTRDVLMPYKYTLTLGDIRKVNRVQRVLSQQAKIKTLISTGGLNDPTAPASSPASLPQDVAKSIADQIRPIAHAMTYTLTATALPTGFMNLAHNNPVRHQLLVDIYQGTPGQGTLDVQTLIGRISGIGRKKPFLPG
ncbi:hypothetical protein [Spirosoma pollinicola]|uniref:Prophage tail endopeptidase domain-containing protein n=1 Tax=Spirosoma pollinicola TaxID=2057025 RepID=A0A2K8YTI7_9BACT|nr:hypothetical protein [Spirosoma pollinicola]AUD00927.1 hypothetical protein CWM47_03315 [Spirosoma pollinicola]